MNQNQENRIFTRSRNARMIFCFLWGCMIFGSVFAADARAELERLSKKELAAVVGSGGVDFYYGKDTARIYFDMHIETYMEIDSLKLGYYERNNLRTRKFLDPEDPVVEWNGDEQFSIWKYMNGTNPDWGGGVGKVKNYYFDEGSAYYWRDPPSNRWYGDNAYYTWSTTFHQGTPMGPYPSYVYHKNGGTSAEELKYIPYTDNSNYQMKYNDTLSSLSLNGPVYVEGKQGLNNSIISSLIGADFFSNAPSENQNYLDWDINVENFRLGTSPDNPFVMDGLVIQLKYDDITSPNKKLTDIIIGSNSTSGNFFGDFHRLTGYVNPKLPKSAKSAILNLFDFIGIFNEAPVPVSFKRDSFMWMVDHFESRYEDLEVGLDDNVYYAYPWDTSNNDIHSGMFLRLGLDPADTDHFGFSLIAGYNELVAAAYEPSDVMLQDALYNWWNN